MLNRSAVTMLARLGFLTPAYVHGSDEEANPAHPLRFLEIYKAELRETERVIAKASASGWMRQIEMNEQKRNNLFELGFRCLVRDQEVDGSNPFAPPTSFKTNNLGYVKEGKTAWCKARRSAFRFHRADRSNSRCRRGLAPRL